MRIDLTNQFKSFAQFRVPFDLYAFDRATNGGLPAGKLSEIYGDYDTGKTRLALHVIANTLKLGGKAVLIDIERSLDKGLADLCELDVAHKNFFYPNPNLISSIEDVFTVLDLSIKELRENNPDGLLTFVWDSVAMTPGVADLEREIGANNMAAAQRAKVIGDELKKLMIEVYRHKICLLFINQIRDKVGVMFGEKTQTVGGKAIKFAAALRMHVKAVGKLKDTKLEETIGYKGRMIVDKCKVGIPFHKVEFEMFVDKPIDPYSGLFDYMRRHSEIESSGAWYNFVGDKKKWHGDDFVVQLKRWSTEHK